MKILLSSRGLFLLGFFVLVVTNIVVISGVASNRSGEPESQITLTERELQLPYKIYKENSGLSLRLKWRTFSDKKNGNYRSGSPAWLNSQKLNSLGFNPSSNNNLDIDTSSLKRPIPKEVFIVLENNGEPYQQSVKRAEKTLEKEEILFKSNPDDERLLNNVERAKKILNRERIKESRLFAIDAGLEPDKLRKKYKDQNRFIITKGIIKARYTYNNDKKIFAYVSRLSLKNIYVPLKHRKIFDSILNSSKSKINGIQPPRYEVKLAFGSRFEPWIMSVRPIEDIFNY